MATAPRLTGPRVRLAGLALCLAVALSAALAFRIGAQDDDLIGSFADVIEVRVMNVDVQVLDRQGRPVLDLAADEFRLLVDGQGAEITNFALYGPGAGGAVPGSSPQASRPEGAAGSGGASQEAPIQLVVLVDNLNIRPQNRQRLLGRMRESLEGFLAPDDTVMVASLGDRAEVLLPFSADRSALGAALAKIETQPARGGEADAERRAGIDALASTMAEEERGTASCTNLMEAAIDGYAQWTIRRTQTSLRGMKELIGSLAGVPGRKLLLYVSDGLQLRPADDLGQAVASLCDSGSLLRTQAYDRSREFQRLAADANSARVTFMPLEGHAGGGGGNELRASLQDSLRLLADETGGHALLNATSLERSLLPALAEAGSYYSLGFRPTGWGKTDEHRIEVKLDRPGLEIRYRQSFRDKSSEELVTDRLLAAAWLGAGDNPLAAVLEEAAPPEATDKGYRVQLRLGIPISNMTLLPREGGSEGRFEVYVIARSADGTQTPIHQTQFSVRIPEGRLEAARGQLYGCQLSLELPPGDHTVAVGIKDRLSASLSSLSRPIHLGN